MDLGNIEITDNPFQATKIDLLDKISNTYGNHWPRSAEQHDT